MKRVTSIFRKPDLDKQKQHKRSKNKSVIMQQQITHQRSFRKRLKENFKTLDMFGREVKLTYKGQNQYKTTMGAWISLMLIIILLIYGGYLLRNLILRTNQSIEQQTLVRTLNEAFRPQDYNMDLSFSMLKPLDPSIGFFTVKYIIQYVVNQKKQRNITYMELESCNTTNHFKQIPEKTRQNYGVDSMFCLKNPDYSLQGNFYDDEMHYLEIKLWRCQNSTIKGTQYENVTCKSSEEIDQYLDTEQFRFAYMNYFFSVDDNSNPIELYLDDAFYEIDNKIKKKSNVFIRKQEVQIIDEIIQIAEDTEADIIFPQISNIDTYYDAFTQDIDGYLVAVYLRFDKEYDTYIRKNGDLLSILAALGGLQRTLHAIGFIFVGLLSSKMFSSQIIKNLYQIRKYDVFESQLKKAQSIRRRSVLQPPANVPDDFERNPFELPEESIAAANQPKWYNMFSEVFKQKRLLDKPMAQKEKLPELVKEMENHLSQEYMDKKFMIEEKDINSLYFAILNRQRFKYPVLKILEFFCKCFCIRNISNNNIRRRQEINKHYLFVKAENKLAQELDVIKILKSVRKFKMLSQAILSQKYRFLLKFQRQNLIETSSSSSDSDENVFDQTKLIENKSPLVRFVMYSKIKKMAEDFINDSITPQQRNIIRGLFKRKHKDFTENQYGHSSITLKDRLLQKTIVQHHSRNQMPFAEFMGIGGQVQQQAPQLQNISQAPLQPPILALQRANDTSSFTDKRSRSSSSSSSDSDSSSNRSASVQSVDPSFLNMNQQEKEDRFYGQLRQPPIQNNEITIELSNLNSNLLQNQDDEENHVVGDMDHYETKRSDEQVKDDKVQIEMLSDSTSRQELIGSNLSHSIRYGI